MLHQAGANSLRKSRLSAFFLVFFLAAAPASGEEEPDEKKGSYTIELVAPDEESEIIDEFALLQEEAIVELASRHKQEIGMAPSAVTVITREDIEASGASTLTDLLRLVPGMDVIISSPMLTSIGARLGWSDENNFFLVLVDGREVNLELLGMPLLDTQPIFIDDIQRIEVIRGPGSFLYGANALAGVVSITTRAVPEETSAWAYVGAGEVGSLTSGARASTRIGEWGFSLSGGIDRTGMFHNQHKLGREILKLRALAEYRWSKSQRLLLDAGLTRGKGILAAGVGGFDAISYVRTIRLAYQSEGVRAQLYWVQLPGSANMLAPFNYGGLHLADIMPFDFDAHTINAEAQWMLPSFHESLLILVGGVGRASYLGSDQLLDGETYTDITNSRYHQPGIDHWQGRVGVFVHTEYSPAEWITINVDLRFDYNTVTDAFLSPRLATVFRPSPNHFIRLGAARSFRKPSFMETHAHLNVVFPADSPIVAGDQEAFREFMTRGLGNPEVDNEKLLSFEAGYRGEFMEKRLSVSLDLYYNLYTDRISIDENLETTAQGLPDLELSSFLFSNKDKRDRTIFGSELAVRYNPSRNLSLLASWTYREEIQTESGMTDTGSPQNMMIFGGRYKSDSGLLFSLYAFTRSELRAGGIPHPGGLLEGNIDEDISHVVLLLGKIGWRSHWTHDLKIEFGLKLFMPISPFQAPHFRYSESGHWVTPTGQHVGGDLLRRMVTAYLQGSF